LISNGAEKYQKYWFLSRRMEYFQSPEFINMDVFVRSGENFPSFRFPNLQRHLPTLGLIYSIIIVSFSGALKLYFAYGFLGMAVPVTYFIAAGCIAYAAYAYDRGVDCCEDEWRAARLKKLLLYSAAASIVVSFILFPNPLMTLPFIIAYLYAKGIGGYRLKGGYGIKNGVVALTWSLGIVIFIGSTSLASLMVYSFFFCKSFINTVLYDVRDIVRDRLAGIMTLPAILSERKLTGLLMGLNITAHVFLLCGYLVGFIALPDLVLISAVHSSLYIGHFIKGNNRFRNTLVDGEWIWYGGYMILRDCFM
jgi:4-hydroxybenzoate polyprenyltransferase